MTRVQGSVSSLQTLSYEPWHSRNEPQTCINLCWTDPACLRVGVKGNIGSLLTSKAHLWRRPRRQKRLLVVDLLSFSDELKKVFNQSRPSTEASRDFLCRGSRRVTDYIIDFTLQPVKAFRMKQCLMGGVLPVSLLSESCASLLTQPQV